MSRECSIILNTVIRADNIVRTYQENYTIDVTGRKGPTPGAITVDTAGTDVDLTQLTTPGVVFIKNLDGVNYVEWGIREPATGYFYPIGELGPGESIVFRFSRNLLVEYTNTGTGTSPPTNFFHVKANSADCVVTVEAYER